MSMVQSSKYQKIADYSGAVISFLCVIHCALTPLVFLAKPLITPAANDHQSGLWGMLNYAFLVLSFVAVWYSAKHTLHDGYRRLLWFFWFLFASSIVLEMIHIEIGEWLMYSSSIALAITHLINFRYCKKCKDQTSTS